MQTGQQQGEFVPAHPRHGVALADTAAKAARYFLEHHVPGGMAKGIVDGFEAVEVDEQYRNPLASALGDLQGTAEAVLEQGAVRQPRQAVVIGQAFDPRLAGLAVADVREEADIADQIAIIIMHCADAGPRGEHVAVLALLDDLPFPAALFLQRVAKSEVEMLVVHLRGEQARTLINDLLGLVAGDPCEILVHLNDIPRRIGHQNSAGGVFEYRRGHPQAIFGASLLADIAGDAQQTEEAPVGIPHQ